MLKEKSVLFSVVLLLMLLLSNALHCQNFKTKRINGRTFYVHTVERNQTLYGISQKYDVPIDTIIAYNKSAKTVIKTGQTLMFPKQVTDKASANTVTAKQHIIKKGETLYRISKQYNVSILQLIASNPGAENGIYAGDILRIPLPDTNKTINTEVFNTPIDTSVLNIANATTAADSLMMMPLIQCKTSAKTIKKVNIALLLPFSGNMVQQRLATEFYNGIKTAADSLAKQGISIHINVMDAGNPDDKIALKINTNKLLNADLIVGPLYSNQLLGIAEFANKHHIPVISPFAQDGNVLSGNPYIIKVTPSKSTIAKYTIDKLATVNPFYNFILVRPYSMLDTMSYFNYKKILLKYEGTQSQYVHFVQNSVSATVSKFKQGRKNIVIYPTGKQLPVKSFITNLRFASNDTNMILVGADQWLRFSILELGYYSKLNLHIPTPYFYTHRNSKYNTFEKAYIKQFSVKPTFFAYRSYDIATYFVNALLKYGKNLCPCILYTVNCNTCPTKYTFKRQSPTTGFESNSLQMVIFNNMNYTVKK